MSTKRTLWHNDDFHLYADGFDEENVYLEIRTPYLEHFVLKIPLSAWKEMRQPTIEPTERYLGMTDDDLLEEARREVDRHRFQLEQYKSAAFRALAGIVVFGPPELSPEEMVERFLSHYRPRLIQRVTSNE